MKIVIEEYQPQPKIKKKFKDERFILPPIPWKWTLYSGTRILGFGYAHTEDDANKMANGALRNANRK